MQAEPESPAPPRPAHQEEPWAPPETGAPQPRLLAWHESWIIRAAAMASFILFLGYAVSAFFTFESIDTIAKLAHDQEIEDSLGAHLDDIRKIHELRQELLVERLKPVVLPLIARGETTVDPADVQGWLEAAGAGQAYDLTKVRIVPYEGKSPDGSEPPLAWLDRDRLRVLSEVAEMPKGGPLYASFKAAEDVRQRYQLVGLKLEEKIRPALLRASATILLVSFFLLASLFILYAQRFKARTFEVIEGFSVWSEKDPKFRFAGGVYAGELDLITQQFNAMADDVEANRQRSLYLEKIASWQVIARKLAHEIKNPLTPIQMMVSQLGRRYKGDDPAFAKLLDEAQTIISEEVAGLRRMVDNFSQFARLPEPAVKTADILPVCRHVVALQKNAFPQHTITVATTLATAEAVFDEGLIRQVLLNLIKNAAEASEGRAAAITLRVEMTRSYVDLAIQDDGPGIPPELMGRIFEAYFTTKHTGPSPGMGLGLAVCQKIVMDHQGTMTVQSRPGETIFTIRLPRHVRASSS